MYEVCSLSFSPCSMLHAPCPMLHRSMLHAHAPCSLAHLLFLVHLPIPCSSSSPPSPPPPSTTHSFTFHSLSTLSHPPVHTPPVPCEPRHSPLVYQILLGRVVARR